MTSAEKFQVDFLPLLRDVYSKKQEVELDKETAMVLFPALNVKAAMSEKCQLRNSKGEVLMLGDVALFASLDPQRGYSVKAATEAGRKFLGTDSSALRAVFSDASGRKDGESKVVDSSLPLGCGSRIDLKKSTHADVKLHMVSQQPSVQMDAVDVDADHFLRMLQGARCFPGPLLFSSTCAASSSASGKHHPGTKRKSDTQLLERNDVKKRRVSDGGDQGKYGTKLVDDDGAERVPADGRSAQTLSTAAGSTAASKPEITKEYVEQYCRECEMGVGRSPLSLFINFNSRTGGNEPKTEAALQLLSKCLPNGLLAPGSRGVAAARAAGGRVGRQTRGGVPGHHHHVDGVGGVGVGGLSTHAVASSLSSTASQAKLLQARHHLGATSIGLLGSGVSSSGSHAAHLRQHHGGGSALTRDSNHSRLEYFLGKQIKPVIIVPDRSSGSLVNFGNAYELFVHHRLHDSSSSSTTTTTTTTTIAQSDIDQNQPSRQDSSFVWPLNLRRDESSTAETVQIKVVPINKTRKFKQRDWYSVVAVFLPADRSDIKDWPFTSLSDALKTFKGYYAGYGSGAERLPDDLATLGHVEGVWFRRNARHEDISIMDKVVASLQEWLLKARNIDSLAS
eukprot:GHVU01084212.1.p1 GENE.GHVU01084212.1~~GHVU01084212.1.p1  ORF type:complete len:621 (+),score=77.52 GHVU01084212.1:87-1949(+)